MSFNKLLAYLIAVIFLVNGNLASTQNDFYENVLPADSAYGDLTLDISDSWYALDPATVTDLAKKVADSFNQRSQINLFARSIYFDVPEAAASLPQKAGPEQQLKKIIYNNDGFNADGAFKGDDEKRFDPLKFDPSNRLLERGKKLELDAKTPIGYAVYIPDGEIRAVLALVYGGTNISNKVQNLYEPSLEIIGPNKPRVKDGIVVVYINTPEMLEFEGWQFDLPEGLHKRVHASINKMYEVLTGKTGTYLTDNDDIKKITEKLKRKEIPIVLAGPSFGGLTSARHAEMYPRTFTRYVSHDGAVSAKKLAETDLIMRTAGQKLVGVQEARATYSSKSKEWLDPEHPKEGGIKNIQDPIQLMHNADDNNVSPAVSISFYETAEKEGKGDLVFLKIYDRGSELNEELAQLIKENLEKGDIKTANDLLMGVKGHSAPLSGAYSGPFTRDYVDFILHGPQPVDRLLSKMNALRYRLYIDKYLASTPESSWFLSEAFHLYNQGLADKNFRINGMSPADLSNRAQQEKTWSDVYIPLYRTVKCLANDSKDGQKEMIGIINAALDPKTGPTQKRIENALKVFLPEYLQFLAELRVIRFTSARAELVSALAQDPGVQASYKKLLEKALTKYGESKFMAFLKQLKEFFVDLFQIKAKERMDPFLRDRLIYAFLMGNQDLTKDLPIKAEEANKSKTSLIDLIDRQEQLLREAP